MAQKILFETFDDFINRRQREKRTKGIREFLNAYKLQKFKNYILCLEEEMKRLYEGKGFWRIKKDGRQYIKKDGSKGIFQPYKNSIRQKLFASNKVSSETDVASRSRDIKTQKRQDRINHAEAKRLEAEQRKRENNKKEQEKQNKVETFETRKKNRDEYWGNELKGVSSQDKIQIKIKRNTVNSIFSEENYKYNEKQLKRHGLTDEQIRDIEYGGFTVKDKFKNDNKKYNIKAGDGHIHITPSGGIGATSNKVIIFDKNGKIKIIGKHDKYTK